MIKDECDRFAQIREAVFPSLALTVRTRNLGTVSDEPWPILLDDGRELVTHDYSLCFAAAHFGFARNTFLYTGHSS